MHKLLVALMLAFLLLPGLAVAKDKRPPQPFAPQMRVEIYTARATLQADSSGFARALANSQTPTVGMGANMAAQAIGGALSNKSAANAAIIAVPLDQKLADYPFTRNFEERLRKDVDWSALTPDARLAVLDTMPTTIPPPTSGTEETVLVLVPSYGVNADNKNLYVKLISTVIARKIDGRRRTTEMVLLQRGYSWIYQLDTVKGAEVEDYAKRWNAMDRDRLVAMLDQGIARTIALMNFDYSQTGRVEDEKMTRGISSAPTPPGARIEQAWAGSIFDNIMGLRGIVPYDWQWQDGKDDGQETTEITQQPET